MKNIEELLSKNKLDLDNIEVPDDLELRFKNALINKKHDIKKRSLKSVALVFLVLTILITYNFDTLAFYGKKLVGYDQIMSGTLKQLNELGKGQIIDKSYNFKNGVSVTLDGIMLDENKLIAFYTVKKRDGDVDEVNVSFMSIKGLMGTSNTKGGQGKINDDKTEIKWIMDFEKPLFFQKNLEFKFGIFEKDFKEEGSISFKLDRTKAMGHTLKKSINKYIKVDENDIYFDDIIASPTSTVITGKIQNIIDLAKDTINNERFRPNHLEVKLIANGNEVQTQSSGMSTDLNGITFEFEYDALPSDLKTLKIKLVSFSADHDVFKKLDLIKNKKQSINILGQNIDINKIYESEGNTYINITTEENTVLTRVKLLIDGNEIGLEKTIKGNYEKTNDGKIFHTRTLVFPEIGNDLKLDIRRMTYVKEYNNMLDIPIN